MQTWQYYAEFKMLWCSLLRTVLCFCCYYDKKIEYNVWNLITGKQSRKGVWYFKTSDSALSITWQTTKKFWFRANFFISFAPDYTFYPSKFYPLSKGVPQSQQTISTLRSHACRWMSIALDISVYISTEQHTWFLTKLIQRLDVRVL